MNTSIFYILLWVIIFVCGLSILAILVIAEAIVVKMLKKMWKENK